MKRKTASMSIWIRRLAAAFAILSQMAPAGVAHAYAGNDFQLVICTKDGPQEISWRDLTGEASPFDVPNDDESQGCADRCCMGCSRVAAKHASAGAAFPHERDCAAPLPDLAQGGDIPFHRPGPPLPSRAPPPALI